MAKQKTAEQDETGKSGKGRPVGERKVKTSIKYPPYVNGYGAIGKLFQEIAKASVPPKVNVDFLSTVLGLKSSSHRALIPLLKKLGFIDAANVPTEAYRNFRDSDRSSRVMAAQIRSAFGDIYKANEYAHNLSKDELTSKLRVLTGASEEDAIILAVVGTFLELKKLADFSISEKETLREAAESVLTAGEQRQSGRTIHTTLGLSYTINLNLPPTTEIEVFNAIFKSLKEHLLDGE